MTGIRLAIAGVALTAMAAHGFADDATAEAAKQAPPPASSPAPSFEPGEISIGEPLQLPFRESDSTAPPPSQAAPSTAPSAPTTQSQPAPSPSAPFQLQPAPTPTATPQAGTAAPLQSPAPAPSAAGSGWLGISVDDAPVPGRLTVVDVAPQSPAALAGVAPNDTLLAINGTPLRNADEMAAALAAISPGMDVKMAVGKGDRIDEVVVRAAPRPREITAPDWQASAEPTATVSPPTAPPQAASADPFQPQVVQPRVQSQPQQLQSQPQVMTPRLEAPQALPPRTMPAPTTLPPASRPAIARQAAPPTEVLPSPAPQRPAAPPDALLPSVKGRTALGVRTVPVDSGVQARYRLPEQSGALVIGVVHDLPASKAGVPPGSVIVALGNQPVRNPGELSRLVSSGPVGAPVALTYVLPGGEPRQAEVTLQSLELPLERALAGDEAATSGIPGMLPQVAPPGNEREARRRIVPAPAAETAHAQAALTQEVQALRQRVELLESQLEQMQPRR